MAQKQTELAAHLFQIWKTVTQMLLDRGYLVPQSEIEMTLDDFISKFGEIPNRDDLFTLHRKKDDPTAQIFVFWPKEPKLGVKPIKEYYKKMKAESVSRAIIIFQHSITPYAKTCLANMKQFYIEQFKETELLVNITKHYLVPQHIVLTNDEKAQLLAKYKLKESQLPRIQAMDPVARYYGLQRGQVVKIIRPSETAGRYVTYRLVV
jgi:DNA-directed RNA polymerase I, II, and III subunit RPABC1